MDINFFILPLLYEISNEKINTRHYCYFNIVIYNKTGIRPNWYQEKDDQNRKATPAEAIEWGADYLVIGRPIVRAEDPLEAVKKTLEEMWKILNMKLYHVTVLDQLIS